MALLKLKQGEARELAGYGLFQPGVARQVPDMVAKNLVTGNPDMWSIEVPESEKKEKMKQFSHDKKMDTKSQTEKDGE